MKHLKTYKIFENKLLFSDEFLDMLERIDDNISKTLLLYYEEGKDFEKNKKHLIDINKLDTSLYSNDRGIKTSMKIGRMIKSILSDMDLTFSDSEIENFVNKYKALNTKEVLFEVWKGKDILNAYDQNRYYIGPNRTETQLHNSCMNNRPSFLELYEKNKNISVAVILYRGYIIGRALLWNLKSGEIFMDRIYTVEQKDVETLKIWAKDNGYLTKRYNDSKPGTVETPDGEIVYKDMVIDLDINIEELHYYPYLDTMVYAKGKNITNDKDFFGDNYYKLQNTDGTSDHIRFEEDENEVTTINGIQTDIDNCNYSNYHSGFILSDDSTRMYYTDSSNNQLSDWIDIDLIGDDIIYSEIDNKYYYKSDCIWSDYEDCYLLRSNAIYIHGEPVHWDHLSEYYEKHPHLKNPFKKK